MAACALSVCTLAYESRILKLGHDDVHGDINLYDGQTSSIKEQSVKCPALTSTSQSLNGSETMASVMVISVIFGD